MAKRAISSVFALFCWSATAVSAQFLLPCGTERVEYWRAEKLWAEDQSIFAICTTPPGLSVEYQTAENEIGEFISESSEVYFADRIVLQDGQPWLNLKIPSGANCNKTLLEGRIKLAQMSCMFRHQDAK